MGRFHHSSDSDYEPSEVQCKKKSSNKRMIEVEDPNKQARKKSKIIEQLPKKNKTMAEKYPLLSNFLRLHIRDETALEKHLKTIGEEHAAAFEASWNQIYHNELFLVEKMERLRDRFRHLIIKKLNIKD